MKTMRPSAIWVSIIGAFVAILLVSAVVGVTCYQLIPNALLASSATIPIAMAAGTLREKNPFEVH
jgi:CBS-domain-containing membrane protein